MSRAEAKGGAPTIYAWSVCAPRSMGTHTRLSLRASPRCPHTTRLSYQSTPQIKKAQRALVDAFTSAPALKHFDLDLPEIVETDASDFALGAIVSREYENRMHPIALRSQKFSPAEVNYDTHEEQAV